MSAFFIWLEFGEQSIDRAVATAMHEAISGFGGDHGDLQLSDSLAIGVQARWNTLEDVGEKQPLYNRRKTECLLFDGRIDNREHLIDELGLKEQGVGDSLSDGQLLKAFLNRFGDSRLAEVMGPFAFVLFDLAKGSVRCARDAMGGRYLVYVESKERLIIASTELAFLSHPDIGHKVRPDKITAWLSNYQPGQHRSCLQGLSLLNPGQRLHWPRVGHQPATQTTFYRPDPERRIELESDLAYAAEFRRLLDQAVKRRLRCRGRPGVMLSGGMDSVPIAISAVKHVAATDLLAYSWVFENSSDMDERRYSTPMCERLGITQKMVRCDDLWPQFDHDTHVNPLFPFALPYTEFQQQTFREAQVDGVGVLLSGLQGDLLYEVANQQVMDALKHGQFKLAWNWFRELKHRYKLGFWSAIKRYLIAQLSFLHGYLARRELRSDVASDFLSEYAKSQLKPSMHWLFKESLKSRRPLQYRIVMDGFAGEDAMLGRVMENKYKIERRYPFRDRQLCEFMLAIPTEQLSKLGISRPIVKRAYAAEFTDDLSARNDKTEFSGSLFAGIHRDKKWRTFLNRTPSFWQLYVKDCNLLAKTDTKNPRWLVMWCCAYYNFWHQLWYDTLEDSGVDDVDKA